MEAEVPVSSRVLAGRYRLGPLLGRGGMAEVYDGYDERLHRPVAVKLLRPEMAADPEVRSRFEAEARSAAGLAHPNVVGVFDTGEDGGTPYIVMERLPGETLADRMAAGPVEQAWLGRVAGDVLGALGAAHAAGLVHRDVKPGNILISEDGCAKVADFGIAKSAEMAGHVTGTGLLVGTPAYLAPERLEGQPATGRSDLYSLGVVLYEALAGAKPFEGATSVATAQAVLHTAPVPLREIRPDVDPVVAAVVTRAMAKDPAQRPGSAREMAKALAGASGRAEADRTVVVPTVAATPGLAPPGVPPDGDATLVGTAGLVRPAGDGTRPAEDVAQPASRRPPGLGMVALGAGALLALLVFLALSAGGRSGVSDEDQAVAAAIREVAGRVEQGDGPRGPDAAERLEAIADQVEAGGGADDANTLLAEAAVWNGQGELSDAALAKMAEVLSSIEGVDASQATTTTAPTTTTAAPGLLDQLFGGDEGDEDGGRKGKGKGRDD